MGERRRPARGTKGRSARCTAAGRTGDRAPGATVGWEGWSVTLTTREMLKRLHFKRGLVDTHPPPRGSKGKRPPMYGIQPPPIYMHRPLCIWPLGGSELDPWNVGHNPQPPFLNEGRYMGFIIWGFTFVFLMGKANFYLFAKKKWGDQ